MFGRLCNRLCALALILFAASFVVAQDLDNVTIEGRVLDANGQAVVGATVTTTRTETGEVRTATTDDEGRYRFVQLKPGTYKVKAARTGFSTQETPEILTISAQTVQREFKLVPAGVTAEQTITVTEDDSPLVDTTRTIVGGTITEREIEEIPNNTRNPLDLVLTLGGTAEEQLSTRDLAEDRGVRGLSTPGSTPEEAGIFGLSGGAAYSNNITIDGLDNNDDRGASFRFQPSIESISEVQVVSNQFSAEYGRASGGRVNIRTRAGGNKFRGRAFYFFRDEALNANTWNNNRRGFSRPPFQNHDPGFTFGGPIVKDKLFFFTAYEYDNIKEDTVLDAWVPTTAQNPRFTLPGATDTSVRVTLPSSAGFPAVEVARYIAFADTPAKRHIFTQRFDWNLNDAHNFTFSYQLGRSNDLRAFSGTNRIADSLIGRIRNTDAFNVTHNYIISSQLVNQIRGQYSTLDPSPAQSAGALSPAVLVTFVPPGESSTTQTFGSTTNSSDRQEKRLQIQDTLNYISGNMTWRFGGDFQDVDTTYIDRFDATGTYRFGSFVFFAANNPSSFQQNFNTTSQLRNRYMGFFAQNDWKVRPNLTFSAGLRYERETVLDDNNNFGPRIALAWNPFPNSNKTVIRFGAGRFFNRVLLRTIDDYTSDSQSVRFDTGSLNVPSGVAVDLTTVRNFLGTRFPQGLSLDTMIPVNATNSFTVQQLSRPTTAFRSLSPDLVIPESYQFNVGFERELSKALVFEANVTYNKTVHLWRETNPNAPVLPAGLTDRNSDGQLTLTDYLLGITTGNHRFYAGSASDTGGLHLTPDDAGAACTSSTVLCYINVNTRNSNSSTNCATTGNPTNTPVCRAFAAVQSLRPAQFASLGPVQLEEVAPIGNSRYMGAILELRTRYRRYGNGFAGAMRLVYTLSRLDDDGIVNTSDPTVPGDFRREWSRSLADRTHRIAFSGTFDMPWWLGKLRLSPLFRFGSSAPFNLSAGGIDRSLDDVSNDRPNFVGDTKDINWREFGSAFPQALADRFTLAPIGSPGNLPRNAGNGPNLYQFNLSVSREFKFKERFRLRPTAEFTNILNWNVYSFGSNFINFDFLNSTNAATVQAARDAFLAPTRSGIPRRIRLGIRFDF
jgi:outer membrane receptor protein involved in Fe transport